MPQVPYNPVPSAQPSTEMTPRVGITTPPAAFGENIGAALSHLGTTFDQVGSEMWGRAVALQELEQEKQARNATTQYIIEQGKMHADFTSLQGTQAREGLDPYIQHSDELRQKLRGTLSSPYAQRQFDAESQNFMARNVFSAASHAAQQNKVAIDTSLRSNNEAINDHLLGNPDIDDQSFQQHIGTIQSNIRQQAEVNGWTPETTQYKTQEAISKAWSARITGLALEKPFEAEKLFEAHRSELGAELGRTEKSVREQIRTTGARNINDQVNQDIRTGQFDDSRGLQDRLNSAYKMADKLAPGDPYLKSYLEAQVRATYNDHKGAILDTRQTNNRIVENALYGGFGPQPKTVDDLMALGPKVQAAWKSMDAQDQARLLKAMSNIGNAPTHLTTEGLTRYQFLRGLADADPGKFLDVNTVDESTLPLPYRQRLFNLQEQIKKVPGGDPRTGQALQALGPYIPSEIRTDKDQLLQFRGALGMALEQFRTDNNRPPKPDELRQIGSQLLQQQVTSKGWLWNTKSPLFQVPVPDEVSEAVKQKAKDAGQPIPTDEQIRLEYVRQQYQKLYGTQPEQPTPPSGKPKVGPERLL